MASTPGWTPPNSQMINYATLKHMRFQSFSVAPVSLQHACTPSLVSPPAGRAPQIEAIDETEIEALGPVKVAVKVIMDFYKSKGKELLRAGWCASAVQESHSQPPSFGQPSAAADAYANGGQNYYTAGWQAVQPKRPQTAAPKLAVPELRGPSSAAQTQPAFVNNQVKTHTYAVSVSLLMQAPRCLANQNAFLRLVKTSSPCRQAKRVVSQEWEFCIFCLKSCNAQSMA